MRNGLRSFSPARASTPSPCTPPARAVNRRRVAGAARWRGALALAVACATPAMHVGAGNCWDPTIGQPGMDDAVRSLTVFEGDLIAGGDFEAAGGGPASRVARWDGGQWHPLAGGTDRGVLSLAVYGTELIAGGDFETAGGEPASRVAQWDGQQWRPLAEGMDGVVHVLTTVHDAALIAAGDFTTAGGEAASRIASWDGREWHPLAEGMNDTVYALTVHDGDLVAGGHFTTAGGEPANHVARWDGERWHPVGEGVGGSVGDTGVYALAVHDGDLIAGGRFSAAGGEPANHVARWDGERWHPLAEGMDGVGSDAGVRSLTVLDGDLIVGGRFTTAGGEPANHVARWDGERWHILGMGMNNSVHALTVRNGDLIAGGIFEWAGAGLASRIGVWRGCPCIADWNGDGEIDVNDFFAYMDDFAAGDLRADLNNDGRIDIADFFLFLSEFASGC